MSTQIIVSSTPKHLVITQTMVEDFVIDPVMGAKILFGEVMDEFQKVRLKQYWWVPHLIDSSGFSSGKTRTFWVAFNLRCLLIPTHVVGVYYQTFASGQQNFWKLYDEVRRRSPIFRAQIGRMAHDMSGVEGKATVKGPSCWNCHYKNQAHVMMPAPGFLTDSRSQAGLRFNDVGVDEYTKIEAGGSTGIDDQLLQRATRASFNQHHPFWCNHSIFLATAEDINHPSYERYALFNKQIRKGNPDYGLISFNFKDYSHFPSVTGKSFIDEYRNVKVLQNLKARATKGKFLQEGLGIWSKEGRAWYSSESVHQCLQQGKKRGVLPLTTRREDPNDREDIRYFLGVDPARGEGRKSDDGAMVALRCEPKTNPMTENPEDWFVDPVWAYKVRGADATQWAGLIHLKNRHFKFSGICMDHGGGGNWIRPELAKIRQRINDIDTEVMPICVPEDNTVAQAEYTLIMFSHGDPSIQQKWDTLKGADALVDHAHSELAEAIDHYRIHFPCPPDSYKRNYVEMGWSEERMWAARLLEVTQQQLMSVAVMTDEKGQPLVTKNGARQFEAKGKKDFAYALLHAYVRFLVWLKISDREFIPSEDDAALCF